MSNVSSTVSSLNLASLGVGSGLDDATIISGLVSVEQAPLTLLQTQQTNMQSASTTITAFSSDLSALQSAANTLSDPTQYNSYAASSSGSNVVASTASGASPGSYSVQVTALAQAQQTYSDPESSNTSALGMSGTIGLTVGGQSYSVAVSSTDSLADIAANISSSGAPVNASVVYDGTSYRLQVQSQSTGAANAITFDEQGTTLDLAKASNTYQSAQDASAIVDGITVTSPTNQISGAIPGVNLALTATSSSPATVTVSTNASALEQSVSSFITAYNQVMTDGHTDAGYGSTAATNTLLSGDQGIEASLNQLAGLVSEEVPGTSATYNSLGSVGISVNEDGTLTLDSSAFSAAVQADPTGVERIFVTDPTTGSTGVMQQISSAIDSLSTNTGSILQSEVSSYTTQIASLTTEQTAMQTRITAYQAQLQTEFQAMEQTVNEEKALFGEVGGTGTFV